MKIILTFLKPLLIEFKWYRKKLGGTWYKIREADVSGFATSEYWDQVKPESDLDVILKTETY